MSAELHANVVVSAHATRGKRLESVTTTATTTARVEFPPTPAVPDVRTERRAGIRISVHARPLLQEGVGVPS
jgi:hypothetical protein